MESSVQIETTKAGDRSRRPAKLPGFGLALLAALGLTLTHARLSEPSLAASMDRPAPPVYELLSQTGLYLPGTQEVDPANLAYVPQYGLWSDGAAKRRWLWLPPGQAIDAANPDELEFPIGTKLWKEFSFWRAVETRTMERLPDGSWRFATYVWDENGQDARLASEAGVRAVAPVAPGITHDVPSVDDCRACHEGRNNPVLGFTTLQLSPARDRLALHRESVSEANVDLPELVRRGALVGLPDRLLETPPVVPGASDAERALRGYLYANCSNCHNRQGPLTTLGLDFDISVLAGAQNSLRESAVGRVSHFQPPGRFQALRIDPTEPLASVALFRMQSRDPAFQMPPLGTRVVDGEGVWLMTRFLTRDLLNPANPTTPQSTKESRKHENYIHR